MKITAQRNVTELKVVTVAHKCDVCDKLHEAKNIPDDWHEFSSHHNHWGNDSIESYKYHEVCSAECYATKFKECVNEFDEYTDAKIDEFEIQFAKKLVDLL